MTHDPRTIVGSSHSMSRRTMVAAALGTSALAYAAVRSGVVGSSATTESSEDTVRVVDADGNPTSASSASASAAAAAGSADDFKILIARHSNMLTGSGSYTAGAAPYSDLLDGLDAQVTAWGKSLNTANDRSFLWNDVASGTGSANMTASFVRLRLMIIQWASPGSAHHRSTSVLDKVTKGLGWLSEHRYNAAFRNSDDKDFDNWWDWDIGSPLAALDAIAVLRYGDDPTDFSTLLSNIRSFLYGTNHFEGSNAVWITRGRLIRAILAGNTDDFGTALASVKARLSYVANDANGLRPDNSYVEHRTSASYPGFAYTGGYGVEAYFHCAWMTYLLAGQSSNWLTPADFAVMMPWATKGFEPLLFRGAIPGAVMGRNVSRNYYPDHYVGALFLGSAVLLAAVSTAADAATLKSIFNAHVAADDARPFFTFDKETGLGNLTMYMMYLGYQSTQESVAIRAERDATYIYPLMDRFAQRRPGSSFVVAATSTRLLTFESINNENARGWYQGQGMTYFYNRYTLANYLDGFWPTVDPKRMPGTTIDNRDRPNLLDGNGDPTIVQLANKRGGSSLVGGVANENCGASMMEVSTDDGAMRARKSWIFLGDYIVCQGSGITNDSGYNVETIVENRNLGETGANAVQMNQSSTAVLTGFSKSDQSLGAANWVHVDGVGGYVFPTATPLLGRREQRSGSWKDINLRPFTPTATLNRNYLTLVIPHGANVANATYGYVFMPNASVAATADASAAGTVKRQVSSIAHTANANLGTQLAWGAVFWQAGSIDIFRASAPLCAIVRRVGNNVAIALSDPTQATSGTIAVTVRMTVQSVSGTPDPGVSVSIDTAAGTVTVTLDLSRTSIPGGSAKAVLRA